MRPFRSGRRIAIVVMILFVLGALLSIAAIVGELITLDYLGRLSADLETTMEQAEAIDSYVGTVALFGLALSIASFVAFLIWVYRVDTNLPALGATYLKFTPGWAVGNFFIPVLNLYRVPQILTEIWQASDPALPKQTDVPTRKRSTGAWLVGVWWAVFWIGRVADRLLVAAMRQGDSLDQVIGQSYAAIASDAASILYGIVTVGLVWAIDQRQRKRNEFVSSGIPRLDGGMTPVAVPNTLRTLASTGAGKLETARVPEGEHARNKERHSLGAREPGGSNRAQL